MNWGTLSDEEQAVVEALIPLLQVEQDVQEHTGRRPSAVMIPSGVLPKAETWRLLPVIHGDRYALLYEAS